MRIICYILIVEVVICVPILIYAMYLRLRYGPLEPGKSIDPRDDFKLSSPRCSKCGIALFSVPKVGYFCESCQKVIIEGDPPEIDRMANEQYADEVDQLFKRGKYKDPKWYKRWYWHIMYG